MTPDIDTLTQMIRDKQFGDRRILVAIVGAPASGKSTLSERLLDAIRADNDDVYVPVFDRNLELSRGSARGVLQRHRIVLIEGNYLLLDQAPWDRLRDLFDITLFINVALKTLEQRLIDRWLSHGYDEQSARTKALGNDIPNAHRVQKNHLAPNCTIDPA